MSAVQRINAGRKLSAKVVQDPPTGAEQLRAVTLSGREWRFVLEALGGDHPFESAYKRSLYQKIFAAVIVDDSR